MQARSQSVNPQDGQSKLARMLSKLASGVHPTIEEILDLKSLFQKEPFHLNCLYPRHKVNHFEMLSTLPRWIEFKLLLF